MNNQEKIHGEINLVFSGYFIPLSTEYEKVQSLSPVQLFATLWTVDY